MEVNKTFPRHDYEVLRLFERMNEEGTVFIPNSNMEAGSDIIEDGLLRCELVFDESTAKEAAKELAGLINSLYEIGTWYKEARKDFDDYPDVDSFENPDTMGVWKNYIEGFPYVGFNKTKIRWFCEEHGIKGSAKELFEFNIFRFVLFLKADVPDVVINQAGTDMAKAFTINRFARYVERVGRFRLEEDNTPVSGCVMNPSDDDCRSL